MGNIGEPIVSGSIPAVGTAGTTYASNLNLFLTEVKNRLEALVPKSSLDDGALDMNGYSVQNTSYLGITDGLIAPSTPPNTFQAYGGDVYWINTGGAVQLTSGTSLNTSLLGGITGDYGGANPAQFRFVDADQEYYAYDDYAGGAWARIWARNFDIAAGATSGNRVRLTYGGAGSYTLTLPPAAPASKQFLQMDTSGVVTADNSINTAITALDYKHTTNRNFVISAVAFSETHAAGSAGGFALNTSAAWVLTGGTNSLQAWIPLDSQDQITNILVYMKKNSDATNTLTARLEKYATDGTQTVIATQTNAANAPGNITLDFGVLTTTLTSTDTYILKVFPSDATPSGNDELIGANVSYNRP